MKRIFTFILSLALLFQAVIPVSAETTVISDSKAPDYDIWMADTLIQGLNGSGGLYKIFRESQEPVYRMLGSELLNDKPLVSISTSWSIFFNSEYRNQFANEQKYIYEILLMDYLKYGASVDTLSDELTGNEFKFLKKLYSSLSKELNNNTLDYIDKNLSVEEAKKIWKNAKIADEFNTALDELDDGTKTVKTLVEELSQYLVLKEVKENKITLLKASRAAAENNADYKKAVDDIIKALTATDIHYIQDRSLKYLWNQALDEAWGVLTDANPVLKAIDYGVSGLDVLFDMTNRSSNNLKLALLYTMDCYMSIGMSNTFQSFTLNKSDVNARKFRECFEAYAQFQMFGTEFANGWLAEYLNGGILKDTFNHIFYKENIKTAKDLQELCQNQISFRKSLLNNINKLTDIYKGKYPVTVKKTEPASIKLNKTSLTLYVGKTTTLKTTISGDSTTVTWKSDNSSIASVSSNGKIYGKRAGTCTITAKANGKIARCKVTVKVFKLVTDISKVLNLSFNQARKKLGMNKQIYTGSINSKLFSLTGKKNSSTISNVVLPEYEDVPGIFVFELRDRDYSCSGAKVGMSRSEINKKLTIGGWVNGSGSDAFYYQKKSWELLIKYKNGKATYMLLQQMS